MGLYRAWEDPADGQQRWWEGIQSSRLRGQPVKDVKGEHKGGEVLGDAISGTVRGKLQTTLLWETCSHPHPKITSSASYSISTEMRESCGLMSSWIIGGKDKV